MPWAASRSGDTVGDTTLGRVKTLVTGGVRSGKSALAEQRCRAYEAVTYLTPGYPPDPAADPEWAARVAAHRLRRPTSWTTVETTDLASAIAAATQPVLIDCIGTWLTRLIDDWGTWEEPLSGWTREYTRALDDLTRSWEASPHPLIAVTNEVGWGVVPPTRSGRLFADLLGRTNQALARVSDEVLLVVAGRVLTL